MEIVMLPETPGWERIPESHFHRICSYLSQQEVIGTLSLVCRYYHYLVRKNWTPRGKGLARENQFGIEELLKQLPARISQIRFCSRVIRS
jgi:hypothetical protein